MGGTTQWEHRQRTGSFIGCGVPGEVVRVSGARFLWLCTFARAGVLEDASSTYLGFSGRVG